MQTDLIVIQIARSGVDNWVSINNRSSQGQSSGAPD